MTPPASNPSATSAASTLAQAETSTTTTSMATASKNQQNVTMATTTTTTPMPIQAAYTATKAQGGMMVTCHQYQAAPLGSSGRGGGGFSSASKPSQTRARAGRANVNAHDSPHLLPSSSPNGAFKPLCLRDRGRDDAAVALVRDRRVRFSDGDSLYALCRSWLRNGLPEDPQSQHGDGIKSLPRPLPPVDSYSSVKKEVEGKAEDDPEDEKGIENWSTTDLLKRHVKRAKKVRSRLREERLHRIARYKGRLALLLPLQVEQFKGDSAA